MQRHGGVSKRKENNGIAMHQHGGSAKSGGEAMAVKRQSESVQWQ